MFKANLNTSHVNLQPTKLDADLEYKKAFKYISC